MRRVDYSQPSSKENNMKLTPRELTQARYAAAARNAYRAQERRIEQQEARAFGAEQRDENDVELNTALVGCLEGRGTMARRYNMDNQ